MVRDEFNFVYESMIRLYVRSQRIYKKLHSGLREFENNWLLNIKTYIENQYLSIH